MESRFYAMHSPAEFSRFSAMTIGAVQEHVSFAGRLAVLMNLGSISHVWYFHSSPQTWGQVEDMRSLFVRIS